MQKVFVYSDEVTTKELEEKARELGEGIFWNADLSRFHMGRGLPENWSDQGSVFSQKGELRWQRMGEKYQALLFVDQPIDGLEPLDGDWVAEEEMIILQDLNEPRVKPLFKEYPHGEATGLMKVKDFRRNGVTVCISPREIISGEASK